MEKIPKLSFPELPTLQSGEVVITKQTWSALIKYINALTSTTNALINAIETSVKLQDMRDIRTSNQIKTLQSEIAQIAQALEGAYVDE